MPSLYQATPETGTVSSANSTSLYSNTTDFTTGIVTSSVSSVNGGTGVTVNPTTGNVLVSIGQAVGTTSNVTFANITATGNLSNAYYTLVNAVGTNGQVLTTNGAGVTTWTTPSSLGLVSSVTGSGAGISVSPTTGAVIVSNTGVTSVVAGTNISISGATGAVTINSTSASVPSGTAKGQVLFWTGSAWTANSTITTDTTAARLRLVNNVSGGVTAVDLLKQYTTTLADGSAVAQLFGFYDGGTLTTTNPIYTHRVRSEYDTGGNYIYRIQTDPTNNFNTGSTTIAAQLNLDDDVLSIVGNEFILNKDVTGAPTENGIFKVERGTSTDATMTWNETDDRWDFTDNVLAGGWLGAQADIIYINWDNTAIDSYLSFKGLNNQYIKWNNTDTRFEFSDQIYNSQTEVPAVFEIQKTTADTNIEGKSSLKLIQRVTDAASNATDDGGANIIFSRTSGASGGTEVVYGGFQFDYYGTDNTAEAKIIWTNDNFTEPSPGSFPGTYALQQWNHERSKFYNDSLFVNYTAQGTTHTATSIITSNTLVFGSAHGYSSGDRIIYTSTTQNGLTQNIYYYVLSTGLTATQCQLGLAPTDTAIALTNGTGLTLVFADLINRVGVNNSTPLYTLDVNGDANVETILTVPSITTLTGDDLTITAFAGRDVTISTTTATDPVTIVRTSTQTGSTDTIRTLTLRANSTGTPVIGFGNFLEFETESTPGTFVQSAYIENKATGDNAGVLDEFNMLFGVMSAGVSTERMVLDNLGNLQIDGDLTVTGNDIKSSSATAITLSGADVTVIGDLAVNGGDITTTQTTGQLFNTTATTVNVGNAATTEVNLGNTGAGQVQIKSPTIVGANTTQAVFNTVATTVNAFGASTATAIGSTVSGTTTIGYDLVVNNSISADQIVIDNISTYNTETTNTSLAGTPVQISGTPRVSQKAIIKIIDNVTGEVHMLEALAFRSGTAGFLTTYAEMYSSVALATFTVTGSGGNTIILANPISSNSTTFTVARTSLD
jgi:hypothetical protein